MNVGKKIKSLLIKNGMKQIKLCEALDISPSRLSNYLSGNREPDLEMLSKIAIHFDVPLDIFSTERAVVDSKIMNALAMEKKERRLSDVQVSYLTGLPIVEITEFFERSNKTQDRFVTNELVMLFFNGTDNDSVMHMSVSADDVTNDQLVVHLTSGNSIFEFVLEPTPLSVDQLKINGLYLSPTDNSLIDKHSDCRSFSYGRYRCHGGSHILMSSTPAGHSVHWILHEDSVIYRISAITERF